MIDDFTLKLRAGGRHLCTPAWGKTHDNLDQCYKVYLPVSGNAYVSDRDGEFLLEPGTLCFISGYALKSQRCPARMDVRWLHFTAASFYLDRCLRRLPMVVARPAGDLPWASAAFGRLEELFENAAGAGERLPSPRESLALACRMEAALMQLVAELLESHKELLAESPDPSLERLRPAIRHMDERFQESPPLAEIAAKAYLAPHLFPPPVPADHANHAAGLHDRAPNGHSPASPIQPGHSN